MVEYCYLVVNRESSLELLWVLVSNGIHILNRKRGAKELLRDPQPFFYRSASIIMFLGMN